MVRGNSVPDTVEAQLVNRPSGLSSGSRRGWRLELASGSSSQRLISMFEMAASRGQPQVSGLWTQRAVWLDDRDGERRAPCDVSLGIGTIRQTISTYPAC